MPVMLRVPGKATKLAYAIKGKPANLKSKPAFSDKVNKRLLFEETSRMR